MTQYNKKSKSEDDVLEFVFLYLIERQAVIAAGEIRKEKGC